MCLHLAPTSGGTSPVRTPLLQAVAKCLPTRASKTEATRARRPFAQSPCRPTQSLQDERCEIRMRHTRRENDRGCRTREFNPKLLNQKKSTGCQGLLQQNGKKHSAPGHSTPPSKALRLPFRFWPDLVWIPCEVQEPCRSLSGSGPCGAAASRSVWPTLLNLTYLTRFLGVRLVTDGFLIARPLTYEDLRLWVHRLLLEISCLPSPHSVALPQPELCDCVLLHRIRQCSLRLASTVSSGAADAKP